MYEQTSPRLSPLWLSASSSACHGLVNHYRDNAITYKAQRQKCQRTEAGERGNYWIQMRQRDVAAPDAKYTKERLMLKLKMMLCVMMLPLVVVGCTSKQSVSQRVKPPLLASGVDNAASPDWQTPLNGIILYPQREADHYAKTTGRNSEVY